MTKKEALTVPPQTFLFAQVLMGHGLFADTKDWRRLTSSFHCDWMAPLVERGFLRETGVSLAWPPDQLPEGQSNFNYHEYETTPEGVKWWVTERGRELEASSGEFDVAILGDWRRDGQRIEWGGIGSGITVSSFYNAAYVALLKGIGRGLFEFAGLRWDGPFSVNLMAVLTESGYRYYSALPRLLLECA